MPLQWRIPVTNQELAELLKHPTVSVPQAGAALGISRESAYVAAAQGQIKALRLGHLLRVPTKWLREQLEGAAE
jgi:hypothetical protein